MRTLATAVLALCLLSAAAAAQAVAPPDTAACVVASARRPAEGVSDDFTRVLQLTGDAPARAGMIRRGRESRAVPCGAARPLGAAWYRTAAEALVALLPVRLDAVFNSAYPRPRNDGPLWSGRGASAGVSAGAGVRYGVLSAQFAPTYAYAWNRGYDRTEARVPELSPFAYPWHGGTIDWPGRFGEAAWSTFDPGQSFVRVDAFGAAAGVSTENLWWGPALFNPILFSSAAAGFPHVFIGTSRPLDLGIGTFDVELVWGRLDESDWFDASPDNDGRLIAGAIVDFEPAFAPGLYIGAARTYLSTIPPGGLGAGDFFVQPYRGIRENVTDAFAGENQLISVFARFVAPGAGLEAWAEWARDDHWEDLADLVKQPDHSQVYTFGVQKVVENRDGWLRLYGELTHLQAAITVRSFRPGAIFYTNTSVRQGYTQRGQLLGAAIGPGADAQIVGADWLAPWGLSGLYVQRIRYDDDAYYGNWARFYGQNGHDVELTAGARQRLLFPDVGVGALGVDWELTFSHRFNRGFVGFEALDFDALFTENNWGIRLGLSWEPAPGLLPRVRTTPAPQ